MKISEKEKPMAEVYGQCAHGGFFLTCSACKEERKEEWNEFFEKSKKATTWEETTKYDWLKGLFLTATDQWGAQIRDRIFKADSICKDHHFGAMLLVQIRNSRGIVFLIDLNQINRRKKVIADYISTMNKSHIKIEK